MTQSHDAHPESRPDGPRRRGAGGGAGGGWPLGRVLTVACLMPILAMVVIGASRFDAIRAVNVEAVIHVRPAPAENKSTELMLDVAPAGESALASASPLPSNSALPASGVTRTVRVELMEVTAYCPCTICCGPKAQGITASGKRVSYNDGRFVAADTRLLPFSTRLRIPGYHDETVVEVIDRGGAIKGNKLDVYFPDHQTAREWGRQILPVEIIEDVELPGVGAGQ